MTTKLVSLNIGVRLTIQDDDGQQKDVQWSAVGAKQPREIVGHLCDFIMEQLEMNYLRDTVLIAKPLKIKAPKQISHKTFNKRVQKNIKALGYD